MGLQQQQQEQETPMYDLQENLAGTGRYLQRLDGANPDWVQNCLCSAAMFYRRGGIKQGQQPSLLILERNLKSLTNLRWQMTFQ
jgi:hypothetical protein